MPVTRKPFGWLCRRTVSAVLALGFLLLAPAVSARHEGTKQIAPFAGASGELCLDKSRNDFGLFGCAPAFRINISIADITEQINFGFGMITQPSTPPEVKYQLRDPGGNIVLPATVLPKNGAGYISGRSQALAGPFPASGGYTPIIFTPVTTGNYFLEFYYPPNYGSEYTELGRIQFANFDITVTSSAGQVLNGRVWSKAWQFNSGTVQTENRFYGILHILSDDSIVTSIDCNGFVGGTFSIAANGTGCANTGAVASDRQSRNGFHTYPQYKVFLSAPDSLLYPTGKAKPSILLPVTVTGNCATGKTDFGVRVTQDGVLETFIELDPTPGADPRDVRLTAAVTAGGTGSNTVTWNGIDGLGKPVPNGDSATVTFRFIHGITHLPMYDIEYNDNGFDVEVIRPAGPKPDTYWDDTRINGPDAFNLAGCSDTAGCHMWDIQMGDTNTINTWWYVASSTTSPLRFMVKRTPLPTGAIDGQHSFCQEATTAKYSVAREQNSTAYHWTYNGTGATLFPADTSLTVNYAADATSGNLSVAGWNAQCGAGPPSTLPVVFHAIPQVDILLPDTVCLNEAPFALTGGTPNGGIFSCDGVPAALFDPLAAGLGVHTFIYRYTDTYGCSSADTGAMFVRTGRECEIVIWMPDAFTPDGDGLNDFFRPVYQNVRSYSMDIFSRTGSHVFNSTDPATGWDGTLGGVAAPAGNYIYKVSYRVALNPPEDKILTGNVILVR